MKKFLLVLGSFAMMLMGTATFTSCGDDDDDDKGGSSNGGKNATITLVENNKDVKEATIIGDDVLCPFSFMPGMDMMGVYHFDGNKLQNISMFMDCGSEENAKKALESYAQQMGDTEGAATNGKYLVLAGTAEDFEMEDAEGLDKESLVKYLNEEMNSGIFELGN